MHIAFMTPSWPGIEKPNGVTTAVLYQVQGLRDLGHKVTVLSLDSPDGSDPSVLTLPPHRRTPVVMGIRRWIGIPGLGSDVNAWRIVAALRHAVIEHGAEAIFMEESYGYCGLVQDAVPVPVVATLHGPWLLHHGMHNLRRTWADRARIRDEMLGVQRCRAVMAPSHDVLQRMAEAIPALPRWRAVIRNPMPLLEPVDLDRLEPAARRSILFVGRFDRHKGGDVMLEAFARLINDGADALLSFVGSDPGILCTDGSHRHLGEMIASLPDAVQSRIRVLGKRSKDDITSFRRSHGLTVIASRYENLNYTLLESLATGSPTICTAAGGQAEIVTQDETAVMVPPGDPAALAEACAGLLANPDRAARIGAAGRRLIGAAFHPRDIAAQLVSFLAEGTAPANGQ
jgi:glycosyltransferase involved in cell wall biosynthesis